MDDDHRKPSNVRRFLRSYRGRIVIALLLIVIILLVQISLVAIPYQREQRIARKVKSCGGIVQYQFSRQTWMPQVVLETLPICGQVSSISLTTTDKALPPELLSEIASLRSLKTLWLLGPQVTDDAVEKLKGMTNLTGLYLGNNPITEKGIEHLQGLINLEWIFLIKTQAGDKSCETLKRLTNLKSIAFNDSNITDAGLQKLNALTGLEYLGVEGTDVSDDGLKHFTGMTSLKKFDVANSLVTEEGRVMLRKALPRCTVGSMSAKSPKRTGI